MAIARSAKMSPAQIKQKFDSMLDIAGISLFGYEEDYFNNDMFLLAQIKDMHKQELDSGEKSCWGRVSMGTAHKNSKNWAAAFRIYNALRYVNTSQMNVLELGCDVAFLREMIHRGTYHTGTNYVGLDIKLAPLRYSSSRMPNCNNPAVYVVHDLYNPMDIVVPNSVDLVVAMEVIEHLEEKYGIATMKDIYHKLRPGGIAFISIPNYDPSLWYVEKKHRHTGFPFHHKEYTVEEFQGICRSIGFTIEDTYGWVSDRRRMLTVMSKEDKKVFDKLTKIMGNQIPTQIFGQLYPQVAGGVVYILRKN